MSGHPVETGGGWAPALRRGVGFLADQALRLLLPESCRICDGSLDAAERLVCRVCWDDIERIGHSVCPRCGRPFASQHAVSFSPQHLCAPCREGPPPFDTARSVGVYRGTLRRIIHLYKYRGKMGLAPRLAELMAGQSLRVFPDPSFDAVLSVPLHRKKLKSREFDQSGLLAAGLSLRMGVPREADNLSRIRWTEAQVGLSRQERERNVRGAFALREPARIEGRRVLLVDDVYTTGTTVAECAKVLKDKGAARIDVFTLARA